MTNTVCLSATFQFDYTSVCKMKNKRFLCDSFDLNKQKGFRARHQQSSSLSKRDEKTYH